MGASAKKLTNVEIFSKRLLMKPLNPNIDNLDEYLSWMKNRSDNPFIQGVNERMSLESLIQFIDQKNFREDALLLGIFLREDKKHIGNLKFEPIDFLNSSAWLGILIGNIQSRGRGFAFEAINHATQVLNVDFGIRDFFLGVDIENQQALKTYISLGFKMIDSDTTTIKMHLKLST